jgi:hypothetical protein
LLLDEVFADDPVRGGVNPDVSDLVEPRLLLMDPNFKARAVQGQGPAALRDEESPNGWFP